MAEPVTTSHSENLAIISIHHPPVNALNRAVRIGLSQALSAALAATEVQAIIISGTARAFSAGADIAEFAAPEDAPLVGDLVSMIESSPKPIIAALDGLTLGGGLELALACHFRIAAPGTRLGFPEINLGLIPGGGGTQLLPRLAGVENALRMILTGETISAVQASEFGLVDELVQKDLVSEARRSAQQILSNRRKPRRTCAHEERLSAARANPALIDRVAEPLVRRRRGQHAAPAAVAAIRGALEMPYQQARTNERMIFTKLLQGEQSRAQRHLFFAERQATRIPDAPNGTAARKIERVAVIGGGTMGSGIALCFAQADIPVIVVEADPDAAHTANNRIVNTMQATAARRQRAGDDVERVLASISVTSDLEAVGAADLIVEAVYEDLALKQDVFRRLDRAAKADAILASNTSYLDVDAMAAQTNRADRVLGMHFFSPAQRMPLLEVVRASATSLQTMIDCVTVARRIGKTPVPVGGCNGFVGNRMLQSRYVEAERLLLEGPLPHQIDEAMVAFGFPVGPFALEDLCGLEISWSMRKASGLRAEIADQLCEAGRYGRKNERGFYRYDGTGRAAVDETVEQLIVQSSARAGLNRRTFDQADITERLVFPMINEAARILEEGIAARPGDIDVIWVRGFGWPAWRGGPLYYADQRGLPYIRDRLAQWAAHSEHLKPAPLLERLVGDNRGFTSL